MVVQVARQVGRRVVKTEPPRIAAIGLRGVIGQERHTQPHGMAGAVDTRAMGFGKNDDLPGCHPQPPEPRSAASARQIQRLEKTAALAVHSVIQPGGPCCLAQPPAQPGNLRRQLSAGEVSRQVCET